MAPRETLWTTGIAKRNHSLMASSSPDLSRERSAAAVRPMCLPTLNGFTKLLRPLHLRRWWSTPKALSADGCGCSDVSATVGMVSNFQSPSDRLGRRASQLLLEDHAHSGRQKVTSIAPESSFGDSCFLCCRNGLHIRHFGFLNNRFCTESLLLCRRLLPATISRAFRIRIAATRNNTD